MKFLFATSVLFLSMALSISAACDCDPTDQTCIDKCVTEANSCVTSCKGETTCYEKCIDNDWPSGDMFKKQGMSSSLASSTPSASVSQASPSAGTSHSVAVNTASGVSSAKPSQTNVNANNKSTGSSNTSGADSLVTIDTRVMMGVAALVGTWVSL
ncbi:hypothetical protein BC941DRAFT_470133 [Chlamydoabsidia padenii]|nr:hypothetical protein BC941DRAFT_470133 [Chlamydoabsidia padenii]